MNGMVEKEERREKWRRHRSSSTDGQVASARNTIRYMCIYMYTYKKKKKRRKKKPRPIQTRTFIYEEGKEKEKMFFFSALRAVVHLEKAISEPAITIQKEKRENKKSCLYTNQERKKENEGTREKERAITKTNEREDKTTNKNTHATRTGARSFYICLLERFVEIHILYKYPISLIYFFFLE
jgi:cell division protein FtsN